MFEENGIVEAATALLYVFACLAIWRVPDTRAATRLAIIIVSLSLAARELHFHTQFTEMDILRTRHYVTPSYPLHERLLAAGFLAMLAAAVIVALWNAGTAFLKGLWERRAFAVILAMGILCIPLSKLLDGRPRRLEMHHGIAVPEIFTPIALAIEETLELIIPFCFLLAAVSLIQRAKGSQAGSPF